MRRGRAAAEHLARGYLLESDADAIIQRAIVSDIGRRRAARLPR